MMRVPEMSMQHHIMACPVCGQDINADVIVLPELGEPTLVEGRDKVEVQATATLQRFNVRHLCGGRVEAAEA